MANLEENFAAFLEWTDAQGFVRSSEMGVDKDTPNDAIKAAMCDFYDVDPKDVRFVSEWHDWHIFFGMDDVVAAYNGDERFADEEVIIGMVTEGVEPGHEMDAAANIASAMAAEVADLKERVLNRLGEGSVQCYGVVDALAKDYQLQLLGRKLEMDHVGVYRYRLAADLASSFHTGSRVLSAPSPHHHHAAQSVTIFSSPSLPPHA